MAKCKSIEDVTNDGGINSVNTFVGAPDTTSKEHKNTTKAKGSPSKGISSSSPTVYLTPGVKKFLTAYKSQIVLKTGVTLSDNAIISKALSSYVKTEDEEFFHNYKSLLS